ncbi:hypothetical protein [Arthrobacter sp. SPG23]|uniref:hypothetical protein n=1 Tax=Arthrobacter sp. SPG23 TaxID=1610703 RepID=UPI00190F1252|nr:hypothetical protein [Arthrobacter sp. SPG23]
MPWAGFSLLLIVAGWLAYVFLSTRPRRHVSAAAPSPRPRDPSSLKQDYLRRIDAVAAQAGAGRLSARASHQELSLLIRSFVRDIAGIDAPRMTLAELQQQNIPAAARAVSSLYPAEFGPAPRDSEPCDTEPRASGPRASVPRDSVPSASEPRDSVPRASGPRASEPRDSVAIAAETAREVVRTWN